MYKKKTKRDTSKDTSREKSTEMLKGNVDLMEFERTGGDEEVDLQPIKETLGDLHMQLLRFKVDFK